MKTLVYINWGRFVADCSSVDCTDARELEPGQADMTCISGHPSRLDWPDNAAQLMAVLQERLSDKRRNWFPAGHPLAVNLGQPHGQTLDELRAEADAGESADAQALADKRAQVLAQVQALNIPLDDVLTALKGA